MYPVHLSPVVREAVDRYLRGAPRVHLTDPLPPSATASATKTQVIRFSFRLSKPILLPLPLRGQGQ